MKQHLWNQKIHTILLMDLNKRYGVEEVGTREKQLFDKLSSIGSNEENHGISGNR